MQHNGHKVKFEFSKYIGGQNRLVLYDVYEQKIPYMVASVCVNDILAIEEIGIKNWANNFGILNILIDEGVLEVPHRYVNSGYVQVEISRISPKYQKLLGIIPIEDSITPTEDNRSSRQY